MRLKETKEVANMIKRIEQGGGSETVQEDIILEGEASWLQGGLVPLTDPEDIEKLNHFKELTLADKHPRFGFTATYFDTDNEVAKEPDSITYADDMFYANFSVYFGTSFGWFGIALRNSISSETSEPIWEMNVSALSSGGGSSALVLSVIPPYDDDIPVDINDASDVEQLEAVKNQYLTGGKNLPTQIIFDGLDGEGKRFLRYAQISNIRIGSSNSFLEIVIETNNVVGEDSYEFVIFNDDTEDLWSIGI